jgi:flagellar hook protein FlgE
MSLYGALFSGVSGLQAQSSAMGAIADNVTNVNTVGYKSTQVNFQTLVTKQASLTKYSAGGVQSKPRQGVDVQGLLQSTTSATDIAISGGGFFIVNESGSPSTGDIYAYSRAGSFKVDKEGYLQNTSGYYLQGWPLQTWDGSTQAVQKTVGNDTYMKAYQNSQGDTVYINDNIVDNTNLRPLNLKTIGGTAVASTTISMGANLPSSADVGKSHKTDILIYDSLGAPHNINHTWTKRASNAWDLSVVPPKGAASIVVEDQNSVRNNYMSIGRMDFSSVPDSGTEMKINVDNVEYTIQFTGADDSALQTRDLTFGGDNPADGDIFTMDVDGTAYTFEFDSDGNVSAGNTAVTIGSTIGSTISNLNTVLQSKADTVLGKGDWFNVSGSVITFNNPVNAAAPLNNVTFSITDTTANALATTLTDGGLTPATLAAAADRTLGINVNGRSLSQVMDQLADRVNNILQTEYGGTPKSPPNTWGERIAGENSVVFHNGSTSFDISVDMTGLTTGGVTSVIQNELYTVEKLDSATGHRTSSSTQTKPKPLIRASSTKSTGPTVQKT